MRHGKAVTYLKAALIGLLTAIVAAIAWSVISLSLAFHSAISQTGSGGLGAVSIGVSESMPAAVLGFVLGFMASVRRSRKRAKPRT